MVLYLGASIAHAGRDWTIDELDFFSTLASFHRKGNNCYLCGDRDALRTLKDCTRLGKVPCGVYASLFRDRQQQIVIDKVCTVFVLTLLETEAPDTLPDGAPEKWRFLKISDAIQGQWKLEQPCHLVSEDINDRDFYKYVADTWQQRQMPGSGNTVLYFCKHQQGGGGGIGKIFKDSVQGDKTPALCLVDTDQKQGNLSGYSIIDGLTLQGAKGAKQELKAMESASPPALLPPWCLHILPVHEIENLIPLEIVQKVKDLIPLTPAQKADYEKALAMLEIFKNLSISNPPTYTDAFSRTYTLEDYKTGDPLLYYDFKKGIPYVPGYATDKHGNPIMSKIPDDKEKGVQAYWEIILSVLFQNGKAPSLSASDNRREVFPPLHKKILEKTNGSFACHADWWSSVTWEPRLQALWDEIGQLLFTWGCVSVKMRDDALEVLEIAHRFAPALSTVG